MGREDFPKGIVHDTELAEEAAYSEKPLRDAARTAGLGLHKKQELNADAVEAGGEVVQEAQRAENLLFCLDEVQSEIVKISKTVGEIHNLTGEARREKLKEISTNDVGRIVAWLSKFNKASRSSGVDSELAEEIERFWKAG